MGQTIDFCRLPAWGGSCYWQTTKNDGLPHRPTLPTKANATRPVSIRLPIADIELAREIASRRGTGYQTVLKEAIRVGLKQTG